MRRYSTGVGWEVTRVLFWIAIWVFVLAPLALVLCALLVRMSGDGLPKTDPYSGALDPTLLDTDAPREAAKHPSPAQPVVHKTTASPSHITSAPDSTLLAVKAKDPVIASPAADGTGTTRIKDGRRTA